MPVADFLGHFLRNFAGNLGPTLNEVQQLALGGEQGYAQQQEGVRQRAQLDAQQKQAAAQLAQQLNLHNTMTPYETAQIALSSQSHEDARDSQGKDLFDMVSRGGKLVEKGTPGAIPYGDHFIIPPSVTKAQPFTYKPTSADIDNYPWMSQYAKDGMTMDADKLPAFIDSLGKLEKNNPGNAIAYEETLNSQLTQLQDPGDPLDKTRRFQIHDALHPWDGSKPDLKAAAKVIDDLRKDKEALAKEKRMQDIQQGPGAIKFAADRAGAEEVARGAALEAQSRRLIPDATFASLYKRIKIGQVTPSEAANNVARMDKITRDRWLSFMGKMGDTAGENDLPIPVDAETRKRLQSIEPVIDELKDMKAKLAPVSNDATPFTLLPSRIAYAIGMGDKNSGLISEMEMMRIRGAAQATGGSPALKILEQAQLHTPSAWASSGQQAAGQIDNMLDYLTNQEHYLLKYGNKYGAIQSEAAATAAAPNSKDRTLGVKPFSTQSGSSKGHWDATSGTLRWVPE